MSLTKGERSRASARAPPKVTTLSNPHQGANLEPPHQGTYLEQASWAGALALGRRYLCSPGRRERGSTFEGSKSRQNSFRLFGRLGQVLDWSFGLDPESWVSDLSQPRCRLSMGTSYGRSPRGGAHRWSNSLEKVSGLSRLPLSALLLSRLSFRSR